MKKSVFAFCALSVFFVYGADVVHALKDDPGKKVKIDSLESRDFIEVECARTTAIFNKKTGALDHLILKGGVVVFADSLLPVSGGPHLTCARALAVGDRPTAGHGKTEESRADGFSQSGFSRFDYRGGLLAVGDDRVKSVVDVKGANGGVFTHECDYVFHNDGSLTLENKVTVRGAAVCELVRLGLSMTLHPYLEFIRYGGCALRGNNDGQAASDLSKVHDSAVTKQFSPGVGPTVNGYRTDVRCVTFFDRYGRGVRFTSTVPMFMQALHYNWEDIDLIRRQRQESPKSSPPSPRREVFLNLDVRHAGVSGADRGGDGKAALRFHHGEIIRWSIKIESVKTSNAIQR